MVTIPPIKIVVWGMVYYYFTMLYPHDVFISRVLTYPILPEMGLSLGDPVPI